MLEAIATTTIPGDLGEKMRAAAQAGFGGIEIFENDLLYFDRPPAEVRKMASDLGLEIVALQPFRDFEALPARPRQRAFDRAERKLDLMGELGTPLLLVCSNVSPEALDDGARAADDLAELAERAAHRDIRIGYEALAWGRHVRDYGDAWAIVQRADHPSLGIVLDTFHMFVRGNSLATLDEIPPERIALVQLADAPDLRMDPLQLSRHYRCFPGQGEYPMIEFMRRLRATGYDGTVSHEIFSDEFRSGSPQQVAIAGRRAFVWLGEQAQRDARSDESSLIDGIEFVEFAAQGGEAAWLAQALVAFGFRKTHVHRSKAVSLYRQGEVSFVVNAEPDSFASSHHARHGTSVCAIGLATHQLESLCRRAERYLCPFFDSKVAPGELAIPAIHGVGGTLVYFVERDEGVPRFFDVDFRAVDQAPAESIGLNEVDHVSWAVSPAEFLSTVLFCRTVLGLEPGPQADLVDPHGMVTSRTMVGAGGRVRMPLNTSYAEGSSTGRFRSRFAGSGVQHIALRCDDVLAAAERLDPVHLLQVPANYHLDLESRFDLDQATLARMRAGNVLYDEDADGRYFQIYTHSINGLFFEVVQRDGYDGYGEANAPVRLAAQARDYERLQESVTIGSPSDSI
jgi:4-hydroxyphenylpyruvate dioxygenase